MSSDMARRDVLLELADRCERAAGPDRELDALIWCALNGKRYKGHFVAWDKVNTTVEYTEPPKRTRTVTRDFNHAKPVTASLDAAMTLVCDRHRVLQIYENIDGKWEASVCGRDVADVWYVDALAATPALALCAACLRAIASKEESRG